MARLLVACCSTVALLLFAPAAVARSSSRQSRLAAEDELARVAEASGLGRSNRALLQTEEAGVGEGVAPAELGAAPSVNESRALDLAMQSPLFMNFTAIRQELGSMEHEFGVLERDALDALTVAESKAVAAEEDAMVRKSHKVEGVEAANRAAALANELKSEVGLLHEQESVLRYLRGLSAEAARVNASATKATRAAESKQATRSALRADAEAAAGGYLGYNMAASSLSYEAVASFLSQAAGAQRAAEQWRAEAELRALHAVATHLARLRAATEGVGVTRHELKGIYSVAGAAKRLLDLLDRGGEAEADAIVDLATVADGKGGLGAFNASAVADPPRLTVGAVRLLHSLGVATDLFAPGAGNDLVERAPDDFVAVGGHDPELARLLNDLEKAAADVEALAGALAQEQGALRAALRAANQAGAGGAGLGGANGLMRQLGEAGVREMLEALKAALAEAGSQRLNGLLNGGTGNRAWWMSPDAVDAEVDRIGAQADRLAAGRKVLEAELERRAARDPAATTPGTGTGADGEGGSALSTLESSVGITVLRALLTAEGGEAALATAKDEAAMRALLAAGGGTLWHQATELEEEARRVGTELAACRAEPSQFRPGCEPRLRFEEDRLLEEAAKRRAAASAERAVLEMLAAELTAALRRCRASPSDSSSSSSSSESFDDGKEEAARMADQFKETTGKGSSDGGAGEEDGCAAVEQAGVSAQLRTVSAALEARRQVEEDWAQRVELSCLWRHRKLPLTDLVAQSLAKKPADSKSSGEQQEGEGPRLTRLLQVCAAMNRPPLSGAEGAGVMRECLCPEATTSHRLLVRARKEAEEADAAKRAQTAARADAAADAARSRAEADNKEEQQVKTALFDYLRSRPEWSQIVSKAMAAEEAEHSK